MAGRTQKSEETALARTEQTSGELAPIQGAASIEAEIQAAIVVAKRFPRDEDKSRKALMKACERPLFADDAQYAFKRGSKKNARGQWVDNIITGPSVNLAREAARVWGNIRHGFSPAHDDEENRTIEAWAWDIETNTKVAASTTFKKLIYRKKDKQGNVINAWVAPDERDLREMTNRHAAILKRNCILELMPRDIVDEAREQCDTTIRIASEKDPDKQIQKLCTAFEAINVTVEMLAEYLGHPVKECKPENIVHLRKVFKSILDGNSSWDEYVKPQTEEEKEQEGGIGLDDLEKTSTGPSPREKAEAEEAKKKLAAAEAKRKKADAKKKESSSPKNPSPEAGKKDESTTEEDDDKSELSPAEEKALFD